MTDHLLEPSSEEMREMIARAAHHIVEYISTLARQPASQEGQGEALSAALREPIPPELGEPFGPLIDHIFDVAQEGYNVAGPGYLAYIPGGGLFDAALADFIALALNRYVGVWVAAPGLVELETNVIRWFAHVVGYPSQARGFLTSGGSLANLFAMITARCERLDDDFREAIIYVSEQTHHSILKAAKLAGIPPRNVRAVATHDDFRVDITALEAALADDRARGLHPFMLIGNAGTTNTGAVDDLSALAEISTREGMWFHADAAYGGFFMLTAHGRDLLRGLSLADSITLDPHKGLFLPYGTGCLLVRDGPALHRTHDLTSEYMPSFDDHPEHINFGQISPELSRDFRGLRVWLPIKLRGLRAFREALEEKLTLAREATRALRELPCITIIAPPQLSIVAFQLTPPGASPDALDTLNQALLDLVNQRRRVFITGTRLRGRFVLRLAIVSFRTHQPHITMALEDLRQGIAALCP